jgi:uncharacterized heparinase superfamily protein
MNWRQTASRWWWIVRCHRFSQLARRAHEILRRRLTEITGGPNWSRTPQIPIRLRTGIDFRWLVEAKLAARKAIAPESSADDLLHGKFTFLKTSKTLSDPVDWRLHQWPDVPLLWRFHFHYQEYSLDLLAKSLERGDAVFVDRAWDLVRQWIEGNQPRGSRFWMDAWHPACISRRLPVWVALRSACTPKQELEDLVLASVYCQARYLMHHLERDLGGNHLLDNLRALMITAALLDGPEADRWLRRASRLLRRELTEQILPHGEHFERSPMYHAHVLEAVLDMRDAITVLVPGLAIACAEAAARMAKFLRTVLHPDGDIPLLGDSCLKASPLPAELIERAEIWPRRSGAIPGCPVTISASSPKLQPVHSSVATGGYWTVRDGNDFLLLDGGPVGADHLPAHAHADLLGFEASLDGRRVFVDSGVFNYEDSGMRQYCRSTAAHNALQVDGMDQCDVWSSFRLGYRGWPGRLVTGKSHDVHWARATHNAYRRQGVPTIGRWLGCHASGPWFCVDWAEGRGKHGLVNRLHIHPDVRVTQTAAGRFVLCMSGGARDLQFLSPGVGAIAHGWYCCESGRREESSVIQWTTHGDLPSFTAWCLLRAEGRDEAHLTGLGSPTDLVLSWTRHGITRNLRPLTDF